MGKKLVVSTQLKNMLVNFDHFPLLGNDFKIHIFLEVKANQFVTWWPTNLLRTFWGRQGAPCNDKLKSKETASHTTSVDDVFFWVFGKGRNDHQNQNQNNYLAVSAHLKNISQNGNLPQVGMKNKKNWNHHLDKVFSLLLVRRLVYTPPEVLPAKAPEKCCDSKPILSYWKPGNFAGGKRFSGVEQNWEFGGQSPLFQWFLLLLLLLGGLKMWDICSSGKLRPHPKISKRKPFREMELQTVFCFRHRYSQKKNTSGIAVSL